MVLNERFPTNNFVLIDDLILTDRLSRLFPTTGFQIITENFQLKIHQALKWAVQLEAGIAALFPHCNPNFEPRRVAERFNPNSAAAPPCRRSAGFQPAVSPTSSRRGVRLGVRVRKCRKPCGLETRDTAGWKPALRDRFEADFGVRA